MKKKNPAIKKTKEKLILLDRVAIGEIPLATKEEEKKAREILNEYKKRIKKK